jgi:hypothetical protein
MPSFSPSAERVAGARLSAFLLFQDPQSAHDKRPWTRLVVSRSGRTAAQKASFSWVERAPAAALVGVEQIHIFGLFAYPAIEQKDSPPVITRQELLDLT